MPDTLLFESTPYRDAFPKTIAHVLSGLGTWYSCASVAIGRGDELFLKFAAGNRQDYSGDTLHAPDPKPVTMQTLYDMASVTKLMSTTLVALRLMEEGAFSLYDPLTRYFPDCGNYADVTLRHLLTHTSGLLPHIPLYELCQAPKEAVPAILHSEPVCKPGEQVYYSCMGFILLRAVLEQIAGAPLDALARALVFEPLQMHTAGYNPDAHATPDIAATEYSATEKRYICGQVHDENARFLGGVSGNAGVFATLDDMIKLGAMLSGHGASHGKRFLSRRVFDLAVKNHTPGLDEARGLGFSLKGEGLSASGEFTSPDSYGHNGYTGTSIYVDGRTGVYFILLTNSVHYGRDDRTPFFRGRRLFHNIALTESDRIAGY